MFDKHTVWHAIKRKSFYNILFTPKKKNHWKKTMKKIGKMKGETKAYSLNPLI
ncbi:MAG: hypothetical protein FWE47_00645 [Oscillospiraceae bacterium]|nr:hypothetical protein [Oscillospiraceae bacterium]